MAQRVRTVIFFFMSFSMSPSAHHSTLLTLPFSLDHLISPITPRLRNRQADLLGSFQIDHPLELRGLLHRQISRFGTFQDSVDEICDAPVALREVCPVIHKPTSLYRFSGAVH